MHIVHHHGIAQARNESVVSLNVHVESLLSQFEETSERLGQVRRSEDVCCLHDWAAEGVELGYQISVDLREGAVQHFASFEHVEDAVGEH